VRIEHGDYINPNDKTYLKWLEMLRSSYMKFAGRNIPSHVWDMLARWYSTKSRKKTSRYSSEKSEDIRKLIRSYAESCFSEKPFDLIVTGHMHVFDFYELKRKVAEQQYSRFPVYKESLDTITGLLHAKDLIPHLNKPQDFNWKSLVRPAFFIHEQMLVEDLLKEFQAKRKHFAIVVDEFGGTDGIITMEDILEEIVGEIRDEYDDEDITNVRVDEFNYIFEGRMMINQALKLMHLPSKMFDGIRGDSETVAGLLLEIAGEIPKHNQVLESSTHTSVEVSWFDPAHLQQGHCRRTQGRGH
jgi:Mg2+/Co2+ transporter CorC